jgi:tape measure domain-containing protein
MATTKYIDIKIRSRSAEKKVDSLDKSMVRLGKDTDNTSKSFGALSKAAVAIGAALSISQVIQYADSWTKVNNRLRAATKSNDEFITAQKGVIAISQEAGVGLSGVADSYSRIAQNTEHLGLSQERTLDITRKLTLAIKAGGATSQEAASTLVQFGQGLGTNALQGEELKAIMEASIPVTKALAKEFGVSTGQLKKLGSEGKLTADRVVSAIENMDKKSLTFTKSMTDGFTEVSNALTIYVGGIDESLGATKTLGGGLSLLAKNIDLVVNGATALVVLIGARYAGALGVAAAATIAKSNANTKLVTSELALLKTAQARAAQEALAAIQQQAAAKRQLAMAHATGINSKAITNLAIANGRVIATQTALTATTSAYTVAARGATIASRALSASMAFLGGPLGVALIAAAALYTLSDSVTDLKGEVDTTTPEIKAFAESIGRMSRGAKGVALTNINNEMTALNRTLTENQENLSNIKVQNDGKLYDKSTIEAANYRAKIKEINDQLDILSAKQGIIIGAPDLSGGTDRGNINDEAEVAKEEINTKSFDSLFARLKLETDAIKSEEEVRKALRDGFINQQQADSEIALQGVYFQYEARRVAILENEKLTADQKSALIAELSLQEIESEKLKQAELTRESEKGATERTDIQQREWMQNKNLLVGGLSSALSMTLGANKKMTKEQKKQARTSIAIQTAASIARAYGENNFYVATGMAVFLAGMGLIQTNRADTASGISAPSGSPSISNSGAASSPSNEAPQQNRVIDIRLDDDAVLTGSAVKRLMSSVLGGDDDITLQITSNQAELTRTGVI